MKVKDFKALVLSRFDEADDECEIVASLGDHNFEIVLISDHGRLTGPSGLPYELIIK